MSRAWMCIFWAVWAFGFAIYSIIRLSNQTAIRTATFWFLSALTQTVCGSWLLAVGLALFRNSRTLS